MYRGVKGTLYEKALYYFQCWHSPASSGLGVGVGQHDLRYAKCGLNGGAEGVWPSRAEVHE